ncbi:MAG: NAD-dependent epimerase/dehydratase family protein, partial [Nitrospinota bacterium]|nr:NAD-dependent epimerase/dehydratase family protein [Nitrospinota bacterium]
MKILVTGSHGLVGSALVPELVNAGHRVVRMIRPPMKPSETEVLWDPQSGFVEKDKLEGLDSVVHLAGENISTGRWTEKKKANIRDSRVKSTKLLAETLAGLKSKPNTLTSASAIGFYGSRGTEVINEKSASGSGFLAE